MLNELVAIVTASLGVLGTVLAAWLALRGRKVETETDMLKTLLDGQAARIDGLTAKVDHLELRLDEARSDLYDEQAKTQRLRLALERAIEGLRRLIEWGRDPHQRPMPTVDIEDLTHVLRPEMPRVRNPPENTE